MHMVGNIAIAIDIAIVIVIVIVIVIAAVKVKLTSIRLCRPWLLVVFNVVNVIKAKANIKVQLFAEVHTDTDI